MRDEPLGMTLIVKVVTRLTAGLILLYGFYVVLRGHTGPGGGFAGGVIIALSLIHLMLAYGKEAVTKKIGRRRGIVISSAGALLFLILAALNIAGVVKFHVLPLYDIAISVMVGAGLFTIFLALVILIHEKEE